MQIADDLAVIQLRLTTQQAQNEVPVWAVRLTRHAHHVRGRTGALQCSRNRGDVLLQARNAVRAWEDEVSAAMRGGPLEQLRDHRAIRDVIRAALRLVNPIARPDLESEHGGEAFNVENLLIPSVRLVLLGGADSSHAEDSRHLEPRKYKPAAMSSASGMSRYRRCRLVRVRSSQRSRRGGRMARLKAS